MKPCEHYVDQLNHHNDFIYVEIPPFKSNYPHFQHLGSRRLTLRFSPTDGDSVLSVDRDLFLNLGRVQNLTVVVDPPRDKDESTGRRLGNPVTAYTPGHPRAVYLEDLDVGGSAWQCDCDGIG